MLQEMSPPDELQDYHATLVEMLAFGIRTFDATPGLHLKAEMIGETVMEGLTFRDGWLDEGGTGERLTRQEYLEACPGFLEADLEFDEDPSHDVLEAITSNLVERAGRVVPPAELIEYHDLLIAYLVLTHERVLAARQQEQDPYDPDARSYAASVYLAFKDLGLALGPTIRLMEPSLKDALAERGCLLEEGS